MPCHTRTAVLALLALSLSGASSCVIGPDRPDPARLLVFTKTVEFRHTSIPAAIEAVGEMADLIGFVAEYSENAEIFNAVSLDRFDAVLFLNTTGDVLDSAQQVAFENFIKSGKGFAGVHAASDTEYDWAWYGGLVGAYFKSHPAVQNATITPATFAHPATQAMTGSLSRVDEWYDFLALPTGVTVLLHVDEATYTGGTMGPNHPIAWYHLYDGGRAFYTAMGHTDESYSEPAFLEHLAGGIFWALGLD